MAISARFICLTLALCLLELNSAVGLNVSGDVLKRRAGAGLTAENSSVTCKLQGTTRQPAFSKDGDYIIGGVFSIHYNMQAVRHNYSTIPDPLRCDGRLVFVSFCVAIKSIPMSSYCFLYFCNLKLHIICTF